MTSNKSCANLREEILRGIKREAISEGKASVEEFTEDMLQFNVADVVNYCKIALEVYEEKQ